MIKLEAITETEIIDITELVESITWSGDYAQAARQLEFKLIASPYDKNIPKVNIQSGNMVKLYESGKELFRGYIFSRDKQFNSTSISFLAYDVCIYLLKNEGVYNFKNITAEEISKKICNDFGIGKGNFAYTGVKFNRKFFGVNLYDIIMTSYTLANAKNKKNYMVLSSKGKISVEEKGRTTLGILYENGSNITESSFSEDISDIVNKVLVIDDDGKTLAESLDNGLIKKYGQFQRILKKAEGVDVKSQASSAMKDISNKASISGLGDTSCITGCGVRVKDSYTGLTGLFYIDQDTHKWEKGLYTIDLTLNFQNIMNKVEGGQADE